MVFKLFTQPKCPRCPAAKALAHQLKIENCKSLDLSSGRRLKIEEYDVSTVDGLTEASFYSVLSTPGLILVDDQGKEVAGWRGEVPSKKEFLAKLQMKR
jgi:thioredoxin-related protein